MKFRFALFGLMVFFASLPLPSGAAISASHVLVVYPINGPDFDKDGVNDSKQIADYYVQKRGIPATNVLGVNISVISVGYYYGGEYSKFYTDLAGPIKTKLAKVGPTSIDVILLVGAIPFETRNAAGAPVSVDNALMMLTELDPNTDNISVKNNPYFEPTPTVGTDLGHFSHARYKLGASDFYMVSRIRDIEQIDQALYADRFLSALPGYYNGNIYIDSKYGQGDSGKVPPYTDEYLVSQPRARSGNFAATEEEADMNIAFAEHHVRESSFPLKWENTTNGLVIGQPGAKFSDGSSALAAPRALFYGGWYNYGRYSDVFEWLPGSVACDLNSGPTFGRGALQHGASAVSYVIDEPYRSGHQRPDVLLYYLLNGFSLAEAATLATPTVGWMAVNEGDPLYTPTGPVLVTPTADSPRTLTKDTFRPALSAGFPMIAAGPEPNDRVIRFLVSDKPEPEVAVAQIDYGTSANYGSTANSGPGYKRRLAVTLKNLQKKTVYHYRITLKDPVGNETVTNDYTFDTSRSPSR
jgi:uncharacterized protein (TIGR03790 family)